MNLTEADIAWNYYYNDMYSEDYIDDKDLFDETIEIYNPVTKVVDMMNALTNQREISIESNQNTDDIEDFWKNNKFQNLKYKIVAWLLLTQKCYIELLMQNKNIIINIHHKDNVKIEKMNGEIAYCKIEGKTKKFNPSNKEFINIDVTKEYYNVDGYRHIVTTKGSKEEKKPLAFEKIPIIEFNTDYNIKPLFNKVDRYNEIEAFLKNIFWITGDPIAFTNEGDGIKDEDKKSIRSSRGKALKLLNLEDGVLQFLEMQGNVAQLMLDKQEDIEKKVSKDFPEYIMSEILSKGDPSAEALQIKALDVESKVKSLRSDLSSGIIRMDNMALSMLGKNSVDHKIVFQEMLPQSLSYLIDIIKELDSIGYISRETGVSKLESSGFIEDAKDEIKKLREQDKRIAEGISNDLFGDSNAGDE